MCKRFNGYLKTMLLIVFILQCVIVNCDGGCSTFTQTKAKIKIGRIYQDVKIDGCLEDLPYEEITIESCVENIETGTFRNMSQLKYITIQAGNLKSISPNFTIDTPKLKGIFINMNALSTINKEVFPATQLERLDFGSNKINHIHNGAFKDISTKCLSLTDNKLKNIEPKWFDNSKITQLCLERNQINHVQGHAFDAIKGLQEINLGYNYINYIDNKAFSNIKSLRNLNLTGNMLTQLNFLNSLKLTKLDVGFNRISYIFLEKNTAIQYFFVFPNPWQCSCLQKFWKTAVARNIGVGNTPSTKSTWRDVYPVCVAQNGNCTKSENYDYIRLQYFKNVNYAKLDN